MSDLRSGKTPVGQKLLDGPDEPPLHAALNEMGDRAGAAGKVVLAEEEQGAQHRGVVGAVVERHRRARGLSARGREQRVRGAEVDGVDLGAERAQRVRGGSHGPRICLETILFTSREIRAKIRRPSRDGLKTRPFFGDAPPGRSANRRLACESPRARHESVERADHVADELPFTHSKEYEIEPRGRPTTRPITSIGSLSVDEYRRNTEIYRIRQDMAAAGLPSAAAAAGSSGSRRSA